MQLEDCGTGVSGGSRGMGWTGLWRPMEGASPSLAASAVGWSAAPPGTANRCLCSACRRAKAWDTCNMWHKQVTHPRPLLLDLPSVLARALRRFFCEFRMAWWLCIDPCSRMMICITITTCHAIHTSAHLLMLRSEDGAKFISRIQLRFNKQHGTADWHGFLHAGPRPARGGRTTPERPGRTYQAFLLTNF